jgi:hypothetical protein
MAKKTTAAKLLKKRIMRRFKKAGLRHRKSPGPKRKAI